MPKSQFSEAYASFLRILIAARKDAGMSQEELARKIGRKQTFISLVERGVRRVDVIEFCVLARAIGVDPTLLMRDIVAQLPGEIEI